MPTITAQFGNGVASTGVVYGQTDEVSISGNWNDKDTWTLSIASSAGNITIGSGNLSYFIQQPLTCFTYKNRVYIGGGLRFAFCDNADPTGWEDQNPGAGVVQYLSQLGPQDSVNAFNQLQGRLAVFGRRSIQIWTADADPNNFALVQTLDNIGTGSPLSVQNLGDLDVLFLDDTGVRSLRSRETTLNAEVDDVGTAVDRFVRTAMSGYTLSLACGIVEPKTKNYWLYVNGTIFVLSRHLSASISAWSTYLPKYNSFGATIPGTLYFDADGNSGDYLTPGTYLWTKGNATSLVADGVTYTTAQSYVVLTSGLFSLTGPPSAAWTGGVQLSTTTTFVPQKFVTYLGRVYCRGASGEFITYGGSDNQTYDNTPIIAQIPWLDDKRPDSMKQIQGMNFALQGRWSIQAGSDPISGTMNTVPVWNGGSAASPTNADSTYDTGRIPFEAECSHFTIKATSQNRSTSVPAILSSLAVHYNLADVP